MAPFARVATWDPQRKDGVRVNRLTEFPAEDVFLESEIAPQADGTYTVSAAPNGESCIGLEWLETRRLTRVSIEFAQPTLPSPEDVRRRGLGQERSVRARRLFSVARKMGAAPRHAANPWIDLHPVHRRRSQPGGRTRHLQGALAVSGDNGSSRCAPFDRAHNIPLDGGPADSGERRGRSRSRQGGDLQRPVRSSLPPWPASHRAWRVPSNNRFDWSCAIPHHDRGCSTARCCVSRQPGWPLVSRSTTCSRTAACTLNRPVCASARRLAAWTNHCDGRLPSRPYSSK